jgi:hypothetical protein
MGLSEEDRRAKNRERAARYRKANPEKAKEISRRANAKRRAHPEISEVIRDYQARYREANAETLRHKERERKFGITRQEYEQFFKSQNGVCAICKKPETATRLGVVKSLAVDHCHSTGKIRGLLCSDCNTGIGKLKDDIKILQNAIQYLSNPKEGSVI